MIKKCREKNPIFSYVKYDGANAIECSSLNKLVFKVSECGTLQWEHNYGRITYVDVDSYVVVGRGYGVYSEKEFYARFVEVNDE